MPLYRSLRNAEAKQAKAILNHEFAVKYLHQRVVPKTFMLDVTPTQGRDCKEHMNLWYVTIARAEADLCRLQVDYALTQKAKLDVTIVEARKTLARCLATDAEVREVKRAIEAVRAKVNRKELASRNERFAKDSTATRDRVNRRLGIPKDAPVVRPADPAFQQRGRPNRGRQQAVQRQQARKEANRPPKEPRQNPARDERTPRPNAAREGNHQRALAPAPDSTLQYLLKEIKKLKMRK